MEFSIGYLKSQHQAFIKSFGAESTKAKIIDTTDLDTESIKALMVPHDLFNGQVISEFKDQTKFFPIVNANDFELDEEGFESLNEDRAKQILGKTQYKWVLENNLFLLEELFGVVSNLRSLIKENRVTFFEELWFILKTNLGAQNFKIIFHDIKEKNTEGKKNNLITLKIEGQRIPNPLEAEEEDVFVLDTFKNNLSEDFQVLDYNSNNGKFMAGLNIFQSPAIFIGEVSQFTPIQRGLMISLFKGINSELPSVH